MKLIPQVFFNLSFLLFGQTNLASQVSFEARFDATQTVLGSTVELRFSLKNANATQFRPPVFEGFRVVNGPSQENSMSIVNGSVSRSAAWVYLLMPTRVGSLKIEEATVLIGGKSLKSSPILLEVVKSRSQIGGGNVHKNVSPTENAAEEVFISSRPSASEIWLGEQMSLDFLLFTRRDLSGIEVNYEPKYAGFFTQNLERFDRSDRREMVGGKPFLCKNLKKIALFPQQTGDLIIESMLLQAGIIENNGGFLGGFFGQNRAVNLSTDPVKISVKSLPAPAPENFCGGVGNYKMMATIDHGVISTDDALIVKITLTGNGDQKRIAPPILDWPAEFEVSAPNMTNENSSENGEELISSHTFEYILLPKTVGEIIFLPETSVFNPQKGIFVKINPEQPFRVTVTQGSKKTIIDTDLNQFSKNTDSKKRRLSFLKSPLFLIFSGATLLGFLLYLLFKNNKSLPKSVKNESIFNEKTVEKTTVLNYSKSPITTHLAKKTLESARKAAQNEQISLFYEKISEAIEQLFSEKYDLEPGQFSLQNFQEKIKANGLEPEVSQKLERVWNACERARFAGLTNAAAVSEMLAEVDFLFGRIQK
jgi:BatD DUF11 like domain